MLTKKIRWTVKVLATCLFVLGILPGCRTAREKMQRARAPQNNLFVASEQLPDLQLQEGQPAALALWNKTETQSVHLLRVSKDFTLGKRYHAKHDLTMQCMAGNAIIELEGERHFVESPATVVVPRLWSYKIIPHRTDEDFVAILVASPHFDGEDVVIMQD